MPAGFEEIYTTFGIGGVLCFVVYQFVYLRMDKTIKHQEQVIKRKDEIIKDQTEKHYELSELMMKHIIGQK